MPERKEKGSATFCEQKVAKKLCYAGSWATSPTTPMPSGAIPTVLCTAGTFSPSAQHKQKFFAPLFFKKAPASFSVRF
jgi:hypothetical protein